MNAVLEEAAAQASDDHRVRRVELLISNLLRIGVMASLSIVVAGTMISYLHHPEYVRSSTAMKALTGPGAVFPHTLWDVEREAMQARGRALVVLGLLLLVATPVMRVAVSILAFIYQKDRVFVVITSVVLVLLMLSFILGKAEG